MRVVIAMMRHETNTFSPVPTPLARFGAAGPDFGNSAAENLRGTNNPFAAYLDIAEKRGATIATPVAGNAPPSGPVHRDAFEKMANAILGDYALDDTMVVGKGYVRTRATRASYVRRCFAG